MAHGLLVLAGLLSVAQLPPLAHSATWSNGLDNPARLAVTAGEVLVTDPRANAVIRFDLSGTFLGTRSEPAGPVGVAVHPDGRIFVSRRDDAKVGVYDAAFTFQHFLADGIVSFVEPTDLAVDTVSGRLYVVDSGADRFYAFDSSEALALIVGIRGGRSSEFRHPGAIAIDAANNRVLVADQDNYRVQVFSTAGLFQLSFGYRIKYLPGGSSEGWFPRTAVLAVDSSGNIYVTDAVMGTLRVFNPLGAELGKVADYGTGPGELQTPGDVALDASGRVLVANGNVGTVEVYDPPVRSALSGATGTRFQGTNAAEYDLLRAGRRARPQGPLQIGIGIGTGPVLPSPQPVIPGWDPPHMLDDLTCGRCHSIDAQPGGHLGLVLGQTVLCLSCHTGAGHALATSFRAIDAADPYGTNPDLLDGEGTSHAWGVTAVNADADSVGPTPGGEMDLHLDGGNIKCGTCHDPHNSDVDAPFLRVGIQTDQMCKECHAPRDKGPGEGGTHPVGFSYPGGQGEFPDGGSIAPLDLKIGRLQCLTCHAVHYADSGAANGGAGDGMLLRAANDDTLCRICHTEHELHDVAGAWQPTCSDCHEVHDPDNVNLALVAANVNGAGMTFQDNDLGDNGLHDFIHANHDPVSYDGICEVCHTATTYHRNTADGDHAHFVDLLCTDCHPHSTGFMPSAEACTACHGQPPDGAAFPNTAGSHAVHMTAPDGPNIADCFVCHSSLGGGTHINGAASFATGADANSNGNIDLAETDVCDACHSPDGAFDGANNATYGAKANWADGVYDEGSLPPAKAQWCAGCHDQGTSTVNAVSAPAVAGDDATWGYYTTGHGRSQMVACTDCHDLSAPHFDGVAHSYQAVADNYQQAFRLKSINGGAPLVVPRTGFDSLDAYDDPPYWDLCFSCHDRYALLGGPTAPAGPYYADQFGTNFRSDDSVIIPDGLNTDIAPYSMTGATDFNAHYAHMDGPPHSYDSDRDGTADSYGTCVACHNIHGSTSPAMVRDGRLIGLEPALDFSYVRYDRHNPQQGGCTDPIVMTSAGGVPLLDSHGGVMRTDSGAGNNGICSFCHGGGSSTGDPEYVINCYDPDHVDYYRVPLDIAIGCTSCHRSAQDNGDAVPPGGRRAVVGEFPVGDAHAHYGANLDNDACLVCHSPGTHADGYVELIDPDDGSLYRFVRPEDLTSDPDLSDFCASCHDADGATRLAAPLDPFGNANTPPDVAVKFQGTLQWDGEYGGICWGNEGTLRLGNSHHDISNADQVSGAKIECLNCHGVHTAAASQPISDPFAPTTAWAGTGNDFCLACHAGGSGPLDPGFPPGVQPPIVDVNNPKYAELGFDWCEILDGACLTEDCSSLRGFASSEYVEGPWYIDYTWVHSAHGLNSKRGWNGYSGALAYELNCTDCHDPHGSATPTNPTGNPYLIRDYVDGTMYVDDGVEATGFNGPPFDTFGTAREVALGFNGYALDLGGPTGLCNVCHTEWLDAGWFHSMCDDCQSCHGHGFPWGESDSVDWDDDTPVPINDVCYRAFALTADTNGVSATGDNSIAVDDNAPFCGADSPSRGLWYAVVGTGNTVTATTCMPGTTIDTTVQVFCDCNTLDCIDGNDDDASCVVGTSGAPTLSTVSWCTDPDQMYYVHVGGSAGASGVFELFVIDDGLPCGSPPACLPEIGACCLAGSLAANNTRVECDALGGDWFVGQDCDTFSCPTPSPPPMPGGLLDARPLTDDGVRRARTGDGDRTLPLHRIDAGR